MKWEELAYSLLEARPNDAVKLALAVAEGKPPNLKGADLRALVDRKSTRLNSSHLV